MTDAANDANEIELSLKAFAISTGRLIAKEPEILQVLEAVYNERGLENNWGEIYERLTDPSQLTQFSENISHASDLVEWEKLDVAAKKWAEFGWVIGGYPFGMSLWETVPQTQIDADKQALRYITKAAMQQVWLKTSPINLAHWRLFYEARTCFENKCYTACASLLISLIDGSLISSEANSKQQNRKTGNAAQQRVTTELFRQDFYRLPGYFHWDYINVDTYISILFERANNFTNEPKHLNRNYLHHGMGKRKVLRKDCIKLFVAYCHILSYCSNNHTR